MRKAILLIVVAAVAIVLIASLLLLTSPKPTQPTQEPAQPEGQATPPSQEPAPTATQRGEEVVQLSKPQFAHAEVYTLDDLLEVPLSGRDFKYRGLVFTSGVLQVKIYGGGSVTILPVESVRKVGDERYEITTYEITTFVFNERGEKVIFIIEDVSRADLEKVVEEVVGRGFVPVYEISIPAGGPQLRDILQKIDKNVYKIKVVEVNGIRYLLSGSVRFIKPGRDGERPYLIDAWLNYSIPHLAMLPIAWYCEDGCRPFDLTTAEKVETREIELNGEKYLYIRVREEVGGGLIHIDEYKRLLSELNVFKELYNKTRVYGISYMSVIVMYDVVCEDQYRCFVEKGRAGQTIVHFEYR
ncbi:MAG: hypothetical protein QXS16_04355 [Pyrobaculum sp.]